MGNNIDKNSIEKLAHCAKICISKEEILDYQTNLTQALNFIDKIKLIDTTNISPLVYPLENFQRLRPDIVTEENQSSNDLYLIPKIVLAKEPKDV